MLSLFCALDDAPTKDKAYRKYAAGVDKALALFETALQEWADYISFLNRLLKVRSLLMLQNTDGYQADATVGAAISSAKHNNHTGQGNCRKASIAMLEPVITIGRTPEDA